MMRFRIDELGENDAFVEVEADPERTPSGRRLHRLRASRALVTDVTPDQLSALAKALEAVVLVSEDVDYDYDDEDDEE